jgi:hypothetical protein
MDEDNWWNRHEKVLKKTQQATDDKAVYNLRGELTATDAFIKAHIQRLAKLLRDGKIKGSFKEFRELVKTKKEILEVVEPEVPVDPERDEVAELLEKFSQQAIVAVAEGMAADLIRQNDKHKKGKPSTKP